MDLNDNPTVFRQPSLSSRICMVFAKALILRRSDIDIFEFTIRNGAQIAEYVPKMAFDFFESGQLNIFLKCFIGVAVGIHKSDIDAPRLKSFQTNGT